mgnify:CR=1 FL=1
MGPWTFVIDELNVRTYIWWASGHHYLRGRQEGRLKQWAIHNYVISKTLIFDPFLPLDVFLMHEILH